MKAISLTQPWASLVVIGVKQFETRSWKTDYRGPLAIHAAKGYPGWARRFRNESPASEELALKGFAGELPLGAIIGTVELTHCERTEDVLAVWKSNWVSNVPNFIDAREEKLGDYSPSRYAWRFVRAVRFSHPIPARGRLGLWNWER